jgi:peroxiredoxin
MSSLAERLDAFHTALFERVKPSVRELLLESDRAYAAMAVANRTPRQGEQAPDFVLASQGGGIIELSREVARGPVVLLFFRGGWCPYCSIMLRAWQEVLPAVEAAGGRVLAISPEAQRGCQETAWRDLLDFPVLSDRGNRVAESYGLVYEVPPRVRELLLKFGHDIPCINGTDDWRLPLGATFVVDRDRRIRLAHIDPAIYRRLEPERVLAALRQVDHVDVA